jgi:23S rRNA (adenine2503-C2)-methyltransferase
VLLGGQNHDQAEVDGLLEHFAGIPLLVNLIDVNDDREDGFRRASDDERGNFFERLQALRAPIVRRYSGGKGRHAACGMLAAVRCGTEECS